MSHGNVSLAGTCVWGKGIRRGHAGKPLSQACSWREGVPGGWVSGVLQVGSPSPTAPGGGPLEGPDPS